MPLPSKLIGTLCAFAITLLPLVSCQSINKNTRHARSRNYQNKTPKVLFIGIDGVRGDSLKEAIDQGMLPHIENLINNGTYTYKATCSDKTFSGPSWSDITLGVHRDLHNVNTNSVNKEHKPYPIFKDSTQNKYPTIFEHALKIDPNFKLAHFQTWDSLQFTLQRDAKNLHNFFHKYEDGGDELNTRQAVKYLAKNSPDFTFFYIADVDTVGHDGHFAHKDLKYLQSMQQADANIGRVLTAIKSNPNYKKQNWLYIITSDHGGEGTGHSGNNDVKRIIPFIVSGNSAVKQQLLYGNKNVDVLPTALNHLGANPDYLKQFHGHITGNTVQKQPKLSNKNNLIFNGDAEYDHGFTDQSYDQQPTAWLDHAGQEFFTILQYNKTKDFPDTRKIAPAYSGNNFFSSGLKTQTATITQTRDITPIAETIDKGYVKYNASADLGSLHATQPNSASFIITFLDKNGKAISNIQLDHKGTSISINSHKNSGQIPIGTRTLEFQLKFTGNRACADNLYFALENIH